MMTGYARHFQVIGIFFLQSSAAGRNSLLGSFPKCSSTFTLVEGRIEAVSVDQFM